MAMVLTTIETTDQCAARARLQHLVQLATVLSSPVRLWMLELLATHDGTITVQQLTDQIGLEQPTISHHLRLLRRARLVFVERRSGLYRYYVVDHRALAEARQQVDAFFAEIGGDR